MKDISLLLLRLTFGGLMLLNHGWGKLDKLLEGGKFGDPIGLGSDVSLYLVVLAEVVCAVLIMIGAFTRYTVIPLIFTMLVAIFIVHIDDPFKKMEMAILYLIPYIILFFEGAGDYSVDSRIRNVD